jgi:antitoxin HicB
LLPELITEGDTVQDALQNANDALAAIVDGFEQLNRPLPSALQPAQANTPLWIETVFAV